MTKQWKIVDNSGRSEHRELKYFVYRCPDDLEWEHLNEYGEIHDPRDRTSSSVFSSRNDAVIALDRWRIKQIPELGGKPTTPPWWHKPDSIEKVGAKKLRLAIEQRILQELGVRIRLPVHFPRYIVRQGIIKPGKGITGLHEFTSGDIESVIGFLLEPRLTRFKIRT